MSCPKCSDCPMPNKYGHPEFNPTNAVEGDPDSPVWIVALNPKTEEEDHVSGQPNPIKWISTNSKSPHFIRLQGILGPEWYGRLFQPKGIAHTDIVKCGSPAFTSVEVNAVQVCKGFFLSQIKRYRPKLLLVLSSDAARIIAENAGLSDDATEGTWVYGEHGESCYVVLSGYSAPRQERYARVRLKKDFLAAAQRCVQTDAP